MATIITSSAPTATPRYSIPSVTSTVSSSGLTAVQPSTLAKHPRLWSKDDVTAWLLWCSEEYSIDSVPPDKFLLNGKALCLLSRADFVERLSRNGDVLYNSLQTLLSKHTAAILGQSARDSPIDFTGTSRHAPQNILAQDRAPAGLLFVSSGPVGHPALINAASIQPRPYVKIEPHGPAVAPVPDADEPVTKSCGGATSRATNHDLYSPRPTASGDEDSPVGDSPSALSSLGQRDSRHILADHAVACSGGLPDADALAEFMHYRSADCRLLWEFIYHLLLNRRFRAFVCWENKADYVFRIANPTGLAELWGQQKNRNNMTYEKLSRALRYYYRMQIIAKVPGKRLTYRFLQPPSHIQRGQRGARPHGKLDRRLYPGAHSPPPPAQSDPAAASVPPATGRWDNVSTHTQSDNDVTDSPPEVGIKMEIEGSILPKCGKFSESFYRSAIDENTSKHLFDISHSSSLSNQSYRDSLSEKYRYGLWRDTGDVTNDRDNRDLSHEDIPSNGDPANLFQTQLPGYSAPTDLSAGGRTKQVDWHVLTGCHIGQPGLGQMENFYRAFSFPRSHSCELPRRPDAQSGHRLDNVRSVSPRMYVQSQPEDLSFKPKSTKTESEQDMYTFQILDQVFKGDH